MFFYRLLLLAVSGVLCASLVAGCGGKEKAPPSQEAVKASRALGKLQDIRKAYVDRDYEGVTGRATADFLGGYSQFAGSVRKDMETYGKVELALTVERVEVSGDEVSIAAFWHGSWWPNDGSAVEGRGNSIFMFRDSTDMPLIGILGDSPFGVVR